jgi:hypothetical protein
MNDVFLNATRPGWIYRSEIKFRTAGRAEVRVDYTLMWIRSDCPRQRGVNRIEALFAPNLEPALNPLSRDECGSVSMLDRNVYTASDT